MKWITFLLSLGVCILTTACAHQTNTKRIENYKPNNIGVMSLFTDKAKVSRGIGALVADIVYSKDTGWEIDTIVKKSVEQNCGYTGKVYLIDFDLTSIQKKDEEKYDNLSQAVVGEFLNENQQTDIDLFLVFNPNAIAVTGGQSFVLSDFATGGPIGILLGAYAKKIGVYTPIINIYQPTNFEKTMMREEPRCQLSYNLYAIDKYSQQIIGQKENVKCTVVLESEFWPDNATTFEELNLSYLKEKCMEGISKSLSESLSDIGL